MLRKTTLIIILCFLSKSIHSQSISFDPYKGTSLHIPIKQYKLGYGSHIYSYDTLSNFIWTEINVSERETNVPFPNIPKTTGFGILFNSNAHVDSTGCYEFVLNSDDGSLLYIDDSLMIDNGGNHQMKAVRDTFMIRNGSYPIKIWYQQLYPTKYGFIFKAAYVGSKDVCSKRLHKTTRRLNLEERLNFPTNSYHLDEKAKNFLDSIAMEIESFQPTKISIAGHTDNIGNFELNQILSLHRAQAVFDYLSLQVDFTKVDVKIIGYADTKPISDGSEAKDNARNRRVEIIME